MNPRPITLAVTALLSLQASQTLAQATETTPSSNAEAVQLKRVLVTGSHIRRLDKEGAAPVTVFTREDIERTGNTSVGDLMRELSIQGSLNINENQLSGYTPGAQSMNLRGLGGQSTLVLVNGRRLVNYPRAAGAEFFGDLNSLPMHAVERIEVLRDGASALYGSDAIAGVVNFILRDNYQGLDLDLQVGESKYKDAGRRTVSAVAGFGELREQGFNVWGNVELSQRDPYFQGRRKDSYIGNRDARPWGWLNDLSRYSTYGNLNLPLKAPKDDPVTGRKQVRTLLIPLNKACDAARLYEHPNPIFGGKACWFDEFHDTQTQAGSESERLAFNGRASFLINDSTEGFVALTATRNTADVRRIPELYGPWNEVKLGPNHPQYPKAADLPAGFSLDDIAATQITYNFADVGGAGAHVVSEYRNLNAGLRGSFGDWDWDTGLSVQRARADATRVGELLKDPVHKAIESGAYRFGGPNPQSLLDSLQGKTTDAFRTSLQTVDARVSNAKVFKLPAGSVGLALGVESRKESYWAKLDPLASTGAFLSIVTMPDGWDISRRVNAAYGELSIPLLKTLEAQVALRHDRYSDAGGATKPKLALKWRPAAELMLRATYAGGFRAPNVLEVRPLEIQSLGSVRDPQRCVGSDCDAFPVVANGGNPALKPEQAKSWFLGLGYEPLPGLSFTLDYWKIERDNEIVDANPQYILDNPDKFPGAVIRAPLDPLDPPEYKAGKISLIKAIKRNLALTRTDGLDFEARKSLRTEGWGRFDFKAEGTYVLNFASKETPQARWEETQGIYGQPQLRYELGVDWSLGNWGLGLQRRTVGKFNSSNPERSDYCATAKRNNKSTDWCRIPAFSTYEFAVRHKGLVKGLELQLHVDNLFNKTPPLNIDDGSQRIFGGLHSSMGRYVQLSARYRY
ncbi:MAG: TonB-dependent receptor plug domain-containing protein [Roseateles asaccharophilus]|uniref:Iron complex outermembrane receptor protein n=1 Tax=Roseateles asaccharophilus TaxID=582607 RepID=A0A4R6N3B5_9BURK|nr:TonB-dependent receptor [Roseateles asaccharophilus]MDN3545395.1 TonB-dependent receptor [Roseateles asaccharophilus]TDP07775.1 iron complex outermembrane receptor protein [Roseateles asaccharophilus]